ncbi:hypothetical protein J2857_004795 [Neorhizobium galegae]|uniref:hypothetical protein n=1 Tax=Neorhizobium galegae TaxID=399 RepID=UPI001AE8A51A|nr:hypothetical protein [Neorhizobium galegae]MBP2562004.1 hypothetical protein [Neorhizobium galegae]
MKSDIGLPSITAKSYESAGMTNSKTRWLNIDEQTDVLTSLLGCSFMIAQVDQQPAFWKHLIVTMHSALQGAMVCHLSGTAQLGALSEKSIKKTLEWHERDRRRKTEGGKPKEDSPRDPYPAARLAEAPVLFERLWQEEKQVEGLGSVLELSEEQKTSFAKLHELRNDFSHFTPKGWSIELNGLPRICLNILNIIKLIQKHGWAFRHLDDPSRNQMLTSIDEIEDNLSRLANC